MRFDFLQAVTDEHSAQAAKMSALLQEGFRLESARDDRKKDREKKEQVYRGTVLRQRFALVTPPV